MAVTNLIPNPRFAQGRLGGLPDGWAVVAARPSLAPVFRLAHRDGQQVLTVTGNGRPDCVGYLSTQFPLTLGRTYLFQAQFTLSSDLDPHQHLLFQCFGPGANSGLHEFRRLDDGSVSGSAQITYDGEGESKAEVRVLFRLSAKGKVWVREVSLTETEPVAPRWVRVACTQGRTDLAACRAVLDAAGRAGVDLVLLPEYMQGDRIEEPLRGPSFELMAAKATGPFVERRPRSIIAVTAKRPLVVRRMSFSCRLGSEPAWLTRRSG